MVAIRVIIFYWMNSRSVSDRVEFDCEPGSDSVVANSPARSAECVRALVLNNESNPVTGAGCCIEDPKTEASLKISRHTHGARVPRRSRSAGVGR